MIPIKKLNLKNFKSYPFQSFDFSNLTVFCGNNSVGKSTAIQALGILLQSDFSENVQLNGNLTHVGSLEDIHNNSEAADDKLFIEIVSNDGNINKWGYETSEQRDVLYGKNYLPMLSSSLNETLKGNLSYQYIEAERFDPRDNLKLSEHAIHPFWLGTKGEYTIEILDNIRTRQNHKLSLGNVDPRKHESISHSNAFDNIEAWMGEISPGYKISPKKEVKANVAFNSIISTNGHETKPINIGFAFSYALYPTDFKMRVFLFARACTYLAHSF